MFNAFANRSLNGFNQNKKGFQFALKALLSRLDATVMKSQLFGANGR